MKETMEVFDVILSNNTLEDYDHILSLFKEYKHTKRDIKLSLLLNEGKKVELIINEFSSNSPGVLYIELCDIGDISDIGDDLISIKYPLLKVCGAIKELKFKINLDFIESLEIKVAVMSTHYGKTLKTLLEDGVKLKATQMIDSEGNIFKFYLSPID